MWKIYNFNWNIFLNGNNLRLTYRISQQGLVKIECKYGNKVINYSQSFT